MGMTNENTFRIKVDLEAQNGASSTFDAVNGGLDRMDQQLNAVKNSAAGVDASLSDAMNSLVPPKLEADLKAIDTSADGARSSLNGLARSGNDLDKLEHDLRGLAAATDEFDRKVGGVGHLQDELYGVSRTAAEVNDVLKRPVGINTKEATVSLNDLRSSLRDVEDLLNRVPVGSDMFSTLASSAARLRAQVSAAEAQIVHTGSAMGEPIKTSSALLQDIGRVISDLPYGFIGIANNLTPLAESLNKVTRAGGGSSDTIRMIIADLAGPAGLAMIGIPVVSALAVMFGDKLVKAAFSGGESIEDVKSKLQGLEQYKDFRLSIQIVGMEGLQKARLELQQLYDQKALYEGMKQVDDKVSKYQDPNWIVGMLGNPLAYGLMTHQRAAIEEKAKAEQTAYYQRMADLVVTGAKDFGDDLDKMLLTKYRGYSEKAAENLVYQNRLNFKIGQGEGKVDSEAQKEIDTINKKIEAERKKADHAADSAEARYDKEMVRLEEERVRLTMTNEEYKAYVAIQKAGVKEGSADAEAIRTKVFALVALEDQQKRVHQVSLVMLDLDERRRKMTMSAPDYEAYQLIKKAGIDEFSPQAQIIRDELIELRDLSQSLMMTLHDGTIKWVDSLGTSLNDLVWKADASFGDILSSFGKMVTEMYIKAQIINPLKSGLDGWFYGSGDSGSGSTIDLGSLVGGDSADIPMLSKANGGIITPYGEMQLPAYANGGIASASGSGQIVRVAEAGQNEAIVPLPDGRSIPVDWRGGRQMSGTSSIRVEIVNKGSDQQLSVQSVEPSFDLDGQVIRIVMSSLSSNAGMRSAVKSAARS